MSGDRFWHWFDRAARADFGGNILGLFFDWRNWLWGLVPGGGGMTFLWAAIEGRSPLDVWIAAVLVMAGLAVAVYILIIILEKIKASSPAVARTRKEASSDISATEPIADIDPREAYFKILELSEWRKEQDRTTDPTQLVDDWREVRLRSEIHKALRNSRLDSWGEECLPGTATTPEKPIPPDTWDKVEIAFDRTAFPCAAAHFKGRTSRELGPMAWVGVKFSSAQIFGLFPLMPIKATMDTPQLAADLVQIEFRWKPGGANDQYEINAIVAAKQNLKNFVLIGHFAVAEHYLSSSKWLWQPSVRLLKTEDIFQGEVKSLPLIRCPRKDDGNSMMIFNERHGALKILSCCCSELRQLAILERSIFKKHTALRRSGMSSF
jgi:hypothetical protein